MSDSYVLERAPAITGSGNRSADTPVRSRVYILPTREGIIFFFFLLTMLLGAVNYNNSLAYLLTFLLGSLYLVCILHTHRNLACLVISSEGARPVYAGDIAYFPVLVDNRNAPEKPSIVFRQNPKHKITGETGRIVTDSSVIHIPDNRLFRFQLPVKTRFRGYYAPGRVSVSTCYPLGLFRAWSNFEIADKCLVYPRPRELLPLPQSVIAEQQGQTGQTSGTDDFLGFRNYQHGDSIRNIAWKLFSREQPLMVKKFSGDAGEFLKLSWNLVSRLNDTEARLSQLCSWVIQAEQAGLIYNLDLPDRKIPAGKGEQHQLRCLAALAKFGLRDAN